MSTHLRRADYLSPPSLSFRRSLDNPWQIQDLDLSAAILQHSRNSRQCGERVRRNLTLCLCNFRQEGRLANGGKPNEGDPRISALADVKSSASGGATSTRCGFEKLGTEASEFAGGLLVGLFVRRDGMIEPFQEAEMIF